MGMHTPPPGMPSQPMPGVPAHLQPYVHGQGMPPQHTQPPHTQYPGYPQQPPHQPMMPGSLYQFSPYGAPPPQPMTLTGQLRLFEADELPSQYQLGAARRRWFDYIIDGIVASSVAAASTYGSSSRAPASAASASTSSS